MGAFSHIYVDPAIAADSGEGNQPLNITFVNASYDHTGNGEGERHLSLTAAFASYTFTAGDLFFLQNAVGGVADGLYEVASRVDDDAILLAADAGLTADSTSDVDSGSPFGDVEYAVEQTTFDTTNGTQVNIKAGTDEVLAAELSVAMANTGTTAAWAPTEAAPCVFRGYTTKIDDGGIGGLSGGGSVSVYNDATFDYVSFIDLHCHNTGSNRIFGFDNHCAVINCELDNTTSLGIDADSNFILNNSYIHNCGSVGVQCNSGSIRHNFFENGVNDFIAAIVGVSTVPMFIANNIIKIDGASDGISLLDGACCVNNSVWSNAGTGQGIQVTGERTGITVANNIVEGFSGTGGEGFNFGVTGGRLTWFDGNAAFNNATNYDNPQDKTIFGLSDNEVLSASAFTDAANGDFNPVAGGNVKEGSLPSEFGMGQ